MMRWMAVLPLLVLLGACGGRAQPPAESSPFQLLVASADLAPGTPRLALTLWDGPARAAGIQAMTVSLYGLDEAGAAQEKLWEGQATAYQMGDVPYWVVYPTVPAAGIYGVATVAQRASGEAVENRALIQVKEAPEAPAVGSAAPASDTRTLDDAPLESLSSGPPREERFYRLSIAEAIRSGKPTIVTFNTPAYCSSQLCGPVLESVAEATAPLGERVNVVHVEIFRDFQADEVDPAVREWNLPSEPWTFVLDADGTVAARLDGPVSAQELEEAVAGVLDGS